MTESKEDNEIIEKELKMLRNKLNGIHHTMRISWAFIIVLLILIFFMMWVIFFMLWYSPSF